MNIDYAMFERREFLPTDLPSAGSWDLLISSYNRSERVVSAFNGVDAVRKHWIIHAEYGLAEQEYPGNADVFDFGFLDEAEVLLAYLGRSGVDRMSTDARICVDITGMMRPHLMLLPLLMRNIGFTSLDVIYSDPVAYAGGTKTAFTNGPIQDVRQVRGFEGSHVTDAGDKDLLVIGAGYDEELIRRVAETKRSARKLEMFGLPSLQPHMYEENRLQAALADESVGRLPARSQLFAPANDPFATAQELREQVGALLNSGMSNLYLSPLATKPQALGFALYYLCELVGSASSVIFPFADSYSAETSIGWGRTSLYHLELDWFA